MAAVADAVEARHAVIVAADRLAVDDAGARAQLASASTIREHRVVAGRLHSTGEKLARIWPGAREERSSSEKGKTERLWAPDVDTAVQHFSEDRVVVHTNCRLP